MNIQYLIIHCSATRPLQRATLRDIDRWHRQQGYQGIGYHYYITRDGIIHPARPTSQPGAHCRGYNSRSLGICYEGGLDDDGKPSDTRTAEQRSALLHLLRHLRQRYPSARIIGHRDTGAPKACPCFDATKEYEGI